VRPIIVAPDEAASGETLVALAKLDVERGAFDSAIARLERVLGAEPRGDSVPEALYTLALAQEGLRRHAEAARTFTTLYAGHPKGPKAQSAAVRASRLWVYVERYDAADDAAQAALGLGESGLSPLERVAALSARALAALARGEFDAADYHLGKARSIVEASGVDGGGAVTRDLGQMYFALGESRRVRSEQLDFANTGEDFAQRFEARAQSLLDAQRAYADAMRAEDAHWSARAGTRIGEMYEVLHRDVMVTPLPRAASDPKLGPLFEGAMRLRYAVLLQKGLAMVESTVQMVDRTHEQSEWAARARAVRERLNERLREENRAIDALPYTRDSLKDVLEELQRRKGPAANPDSASDG
jgi:tetratricopeptide (TPR) repeat protein